MMIEAAFAGGQSGGNHIDRNTFVDAATSLVHPSTTSNGGGVIASFLYDLFRLDLADEEEAAILSPSPPNGADERRGERWILAFGAFVILGGNTIRDQLRLCFDLFDKDGNDHLNDDELALLLSTLTTRHRQAMIADHRRGKESPLRGSNPDSRGDEPGKEGTSNVEAGGFSRASQWTLGGTGRQQALPPLLVGYARIELENPLHQTRDCRELREISMMISNIEGALDDRGSSEKESCVPLPPLVGISGEGDVCSSLLAFPYEEREAFPYEEGEDARSKRLRAEASSATLALEAARVQVSYLEESIKGQAEVQEPPPGGRQGSKLREEEEQAQYRLEGEETEGVNETSDVSPFAGSSYEEEDIPDVGDVATSVGDAPRIMQRKLIPDATSKRRAVISSRNRVEERSSLHAYIPTSLFLFVVVLTMACCCGCRDVPAIRNTGM